MLIIEGGSRARCDSQTATVAFPPTFDDNYPFRGLGNVSPVRWRWSKLSGCAAAMVHRSRGGRRAVLTNHNRCWIWGRNVVLETLRAGRWPILELLVSERAEPDATREVRRTCEALDLPLSEVDDAVLERTCRAGDHQGFAARMSEFPYVAWSDLWPLLPAVPRLVVLDRIQDPFNLGAMLRSAEVLGIDAIILGLAEQTGVNSQVARSSAGAVNHVPIARVESLAETLDDLSRRGVTCWAASEKSSRPAWAASLSGPTAIVIGNEGRGVHPELLQRCAGALQIPVVGRVGSLNAAVSAGILFYEVERQRTLAQKESQP